MESIFNFNNNLKNTHNAANLAEVLDVAKLLNHYNDYCLLFNEAENFFKQGDLQKGYNSIYKIWMSPTMVPALLLAQCVYNHKLIVPNWLFKGNLYHHLVQKTHGGTRPIVTPSQNQRVCMAVLNNILQTSCESWSHKTTGFRPNYSTRIAIDLLANDMRTTLEKHNKMILISFDLKTAFNSVNLNHLFHSLKFKHLPHSMKKVMWNWQQLSVVRVDGLAQGFAYSPTLFAWYLDTVFVRHTNFIAYADNISGVYTTLQQAQEAINNAKNLLKPTGLEINDSTVNIKTIDLSSDKTLHNWLGHTITLPDCSVIYATTQQNLNKKQPNIITIDQWKSMLDSSNWVQNVLNDWNSIKKTI